jgi:S-adenosylmethionine:tRNA ribosyltransferase-isomerase
MRGASNYFSPLAMRTADFDYALPRELIAQRPLRRRDGCRLMVLDRMSGAVEHRLFHDLPDEMRPGDLLVFNDTKVLPARLFCRKATGGMVELLFTEPLGPRTWKALVRPGRGVRAGALLYVNGDPGCGTLRVEEETPDGGRVVGLSEGGRRGSMTELLEKHGHVPLPPYIRRPDAGSDRMDYQTVYAREPGAVAAPTAGLHFTPRLLAALRRRGAGLAFLTLHVGAGTFLPVKVSDPREHPMHGEEFALPEETAAAVVRTKAAGGRVVAVGTTVARVLEYCARAPHGLSASRGRTSLKILPPYEFRVTDGLVTNFHLPRSTLLMLVSAFASREAVLAAYAEAVKERYRFFSYGDAMFIG